MRRYRLAFRAWRRSRPFWGAAFVVLGAAEILLTYHAPFGLVLHFGLYGLAGFLVPSLLGVLGLMIAFDPAHRTFYSVLAVLASLGTWLTSNLGGFIIGMLLGVVGGSLAFGWQYGERPVRKRKRRRVRARATG
jgi:prepilin signal peptidase PulO-like enzyme (type II secretory pathway)